MEGKETRRHTTLILQRVIQPEHNRWTKGCILPFLKKGDLGIAKNYRGIILTSIAAKIYSDLPLNRIEPGIEKVNFDNPSNIGKCSCKKIFRQYYYS